MQMVFESKPGSHRKPLYMLCFGSKSPRRLLTAVVLFPGLTLADLTGTIVISVFMVGFGLVCFTVQVG